MSGFRNGNLLFIGVEAGYRLKKYDKIENRGLSLFNMTRDQLSAFWAEERASHGYVDLETLEVVKPNGLRIPFIPDTKAYDRNWDWVSRHGIVK